MTSLKKEDIFNYIDDYLNNKLSYTDFLKKVNPFIYDLEDGKIKETEFRKIISTLCRLIDSYHDYNIPFSEFNKSLKNIASLRQKYQ